MAIVNQYTIIYFILMVHGSMYAYRINRNLGFKTIARFTNGKDKCDFDLSTARGILKDATNSLNKCNLRIGNLYTGSKYSIKSIDLIIGKEVTNFSLCPNSHRSNKNLHINCSSWITEEYIMWIDVYACSINDAQCVRINNYCVCHCIPGYILEGKKCLKERVAIGGTCEHNRQCKGTAFANVCDHDVCSCSPGYIQIGRKCYPVKVTIGDECAFNLQCNGTKFATVCDHGSCLCSPGYIQIDRKCYPGTNIGVTVGSLFGGFILGVIVTAVVTTLMYRRLNFRTPNRKEPDVMFAANREYGTAGGAQISFTNNKKQNVATLSPYSFAKETQGFNLSSKQDDKRTDDVYNHLREQTEQDDDTYDHACAVPNHSSDLSDYSNIHDATNFRTSASKDGDDYSTLRN
nr:uncharacterized protein LOC105328276 isoform X7 [Crassostrea gigas]